MNSSDVFISYRRKDVEFVKKLAQAFTELGREVWVDWEDIPPGVADFSREIQLGIEGANTFVAVLSPDFLDSEYCLNELRHAAELNKRIIPIVHRPLDGGSVPESIRAINWIYFTPHAGQTNDFPSAFKAVTQAIDTDYDYLREHTRLLNRAQGWLTNDRNTSFLISGAELDAAENWLARAMQHTPTAATMHTEFILQSRKAQTQRQRRLLSGALVLLALAVIGLVVAVLGGLEARRQQLIAERRADETLSLAAASAAEDEVAAGEYLAGFQLAYYASTFIDQPPTQAQQALSQIAFLPGTRYAFFDDLPADHSFFSGLEAGQSARSSDQSGTTLLAEDDGILHIVSPDDRPIMRLHRLHRPLSSVAPDYDYDEAINPAVIAVYNQSGYYNVPIVLNPDHQFVAVGGEGGLQVVFNDITAARFQTLHEHTLPIDALFYSQDGRYLVSRASTDLLQNTSLIDREFFVWDTSTWQTIFRLDTFERNRDLFAVSDDGLHLLFVETSPPGYTLWDVRDSRLLWGDQPSGRPIMEVAFAPDGDSLVVTSVPTLTMRPPRDFAIFDLAGNRITGFGGPSSSNVLDLPILFTPEGDSLRLINDDGSVQQIALQTGDTSPDATIRYPTIVGSSSNGQYVALYDFDGSTYIIWDIEAGEVVGSFSDDNFFSALTISGDGRYLAYGLTSENGSQHLVIRKSVTGIEAARFDDYAGSSDYVGATAFTFSTDSKILIYADSQDNLLLVDTTNWEQQGLLRGVPGTISDLKMSQDQRLVAAAGERGTVLVWNISSGSVVQHIEGAGAVAKLSISPDGSMLLVGDESGKLTLWRLANIDDVLTWVQANRALVPLTCDDLLHAQVIASADLCPID
jgi:WD40 repeat protein